MPNNIWRLRVASNDSILSERRWVKHGDAVAWAKTFMSNSNFSYILEVIDVATNRYDE